MTIATPTRAVILTPTGNRTPVEKAIVDSIIDDFDSETYLHIEFHKPDGGAHAWYAWTAGGDTLGDRVDRDAQISGFDAADWLFVPGRYRTEHTRGRIHTSAYPLRPIHADILNSRRSDPADRAKARKFLDLMAEGKGRPRPDIEDPDYLGPWLGVGPALIRNR